MLLLLLFMTTPSYACLRVKPVTPGMPATPCKSCTPLTPTQAGQGAKPMDPPDGVIDKTSACTVVGTNGTCKGPTASIGFWDIDGLDAGGINGADAISASLTCNAEGTAWEYEGMTMTRIECAATLPYACARCAENLLEVRTDVEFGVDMTSDDTTAACQRTFTCEGASIALFEGNEVDLGQISHDDPNDHSPIIYTVECNAAGTGWVDSRAPDMIITSVACIHPGPPVCAMCDKKLIALMESDPAKGFEGDLISEPLPTRCAVWTLKCIGANARIEYFTGIGVQAGVINDGTMLATFVMTCNKDASAWEYPAGMKITAVACYHD